MFSVTKDGQLEDVKYIPLKDVNGELVCYVVKLFGSPVCQIYECPDGWSVIVSGTKCEKHSNAPQLVYGFSNRRRCVEYALQVVGLWD